MLLKIINIDKKFRKGKKNTLLKFKHNVVTSDRVNKQ